MDLVGEQDVPLGGGEAGHRGADERRLLLPQQHFVGPGPGVVRGVDEQVGAAPVALLALDERRDEVSRDRDRVGHERVALDPRARGHDAGQGLLDDVLAGGGVADPGGDHAPDDRHEVQDRVLVRGVGLRR